jgi:hypothetical protein
MLVIRIFHDDSIVRFFRNINVKLSNIMKYRGMVYGLGLFLILIF